MHCIHNEILNDLHKSIIYNEIFKKKDVILFCIKGPTFLYMTRNLINLIIIEL